MNPNELKYLWASPENGLSLEKANQFAAKAIAQVNRERRRRQGLLVYVFVMVPLVTLVAGWQMVSHRIDWEEAWPATLILAAQWITALTLLRIFRQSPASLAAQESIRATVERLAQQTRARCRELQTLLGLFLVAIPLTSFAIHQLHESGKMRPHEAASAGMLFAAIMVGMGGWILFDLFARKLPEKRHLEDLMRDYR